MRNPVNVYLLAQSCYRCHTVPDERLVNVGGHHAGSLDFELVSWSQGTVRHNFVRTDGKVNAEVTEGGVWHYVRTANGSIRGETSVSSVQTESTDPGRDFENCLGCSVKA